MYRSESVAAVSRVAIAAGATEVARALVAGSERVTMRDELFVDTAAAIVREADGVSDPAAWATLETRWQEYGNLFERGTSRARTRADRRPGCRGRGHGRLEASASLRWGTEDPNTALTYFPPVWTKNPRSAPSSRKRRPDRTVIGGSGEGDQRVIVGQTAQNIVGLVVGAAATFVAKILMTHRLGGDLFGIVTLGTQFAFIAAAATRFGMDIASVRLVAILVGRGDRRAAAASFDARR